MCYALPSFKTKHDAGMLDRIAEVMRPPAAVRPSVWIAENVHIAGTQSATPGPFNIEFLPWIADLLDTEFDHPDKLGWIAKKPAQCGYTFARIALFFEAARRKRPRMMYVTNSDPEAVKYRVEVFDPMLTRSSALCRKPFDTASDDGKRDVQESKPYNGGMLDFVGATTPGNISGWPYADICLDEYEQSNDAFPKAFGALWGFGQNRQKRVPRKWMTAHSHPRKSDEGIDKLIKQWSDQAEWTWDCPHCSAPIRPRWEMVHYTRSDAEGMPDPESAELRCPACQKPIADADRRRVVQRRARGGSGRFESPLDPAEARKRDYVGRSVHALSDPTVTVTGLARAFANCAGEPEVMTFMNKTLGEDYSLSTANLKVEDVTALMVKTPRLIVPGGQFGCRNLFAGVDVQAQETFVAWAATFDARGMMYVVDTRVIPGGFGRLAEWAQSLSVPVEGGGVLGLDLLTIDAGGSNSGWILDNCRAIVHNSATNRRVRMLPIQFVKYLNNHDWVREVPPEKQFHPVRRDLGPLKRYVAHRHTVLDRLLSRVAGGEENARVRFLCTVPSFLPAHLCANSLEIVETSYKQAKPVSEWKKKKGARDDFAMAGAMCEFGAVVEYQLDALPLRASMENAQAQPAAKPSGGERSDDSARQLPGRGNQFNYSGSESRGAIRGRGGSSFFNFGDES